MTERRGDPKVPVLERAERIEAQVRWLLDELNEHVELLRAELERREGKRVD